MLLSLVYLLRAGIDCQSGTDEVWLKKYRKQQSKMKSARWGSASGIEFLFSPEKLFRDFVVRTVYEHYVTESLWNIFLMQVCFPINLFRKQCLPRYLTKLLCRTQMSHTSNVFIFFSPNRLFWFVQNPDEIYLTFILPHQFTLSNPRWNKRIAQLSLGNTPWI